jgi:AAA domain/Bifunctional DNA primase/polymerase, N-terminal
MRDQPVNIRRAILHAGYFPLPANGKAVYLDDWSNIRATDEDISKWETTQGQARNTGVLTFRTPFADIDIYDAAVADEIESVVRKYAAGGVVLVRYGRAPKCAIAFRTDKPFDKTRTPVFIDPQGRENFVEILCDGQQLIVAGIHPETKAPYTWAPSPLWAVQWGDLPYLDETTAHAMREELTAILRRTGWKEKGADRQRPSISERAVNGIAAPDIIAEIGKREIAYGTAAIEKAAAALAAAVKGERNDLLNKKAFSLGRQAAAGRLTRDEAEQRLLEACHQNGLIGDDGIRAAEKTFDSGFQDGMKKPAEALRDRDDEETKSEETKSAHEETKGAAPPFIQTSAQFVADFVPPDYIVDGLLQEGFLYSLTGATGAGKTSITLRLAASTALGVVFAGRETKKRRVLYLAAENPDDVRMRWIALSQHMGFDIGPVEVFFVKGVFKISRAKERLKEEAEKLGGDFGLVIIDTSPVFYEGDDENSRTQQGRHAEMLRELIDAIPGRPAVIANCHPVKNAAPDNLLPAGGGNFLNQIDGNLTAAKIESTTELHTQGKFRGVEFAPMHFLIKTVTHECVKDSRGRLIPTVICEWISDKEKEAIAAQKVSDEDTILRFIADDPKASQSTLAIKMGWKLHNGEPHKVKAGRCIKVLLKHKLIKETRRGNYRITPEGENVLKEAGSGQ